MPAHRIFAPFALAAALLVGCTTDRGRATSEGSHDHGHDHSPDSSVTNRIDVPESVRQNLGITFARVQRRHVAQTIRLPGRFEAQPLAQREYRAAAPGRVEFLVKQYDQVTTGTPLYRLDSPEWRRMQQTLADADAAVRSTSAALMAAQVSRQGAPNASEVAKRRLEADDRHDESVREALAIAEQRVAQLERLQKLVGGRQAELSQARAQLADARTAVARTDEERADLEQQYLQLQTESSGSFGTSATLETVVAARRSEYEAARLKLRLARATARSMLGLANNTDLDQMVADPESSTSIPLWQAIDVIEVEALAPGVVQSVDVPTGTYIEAAALLMTTVDPQLLRFRGTALQSDIRELAAATVASIVPPDSSSVDPGTSIPGTFQVALEAHPENRTIDAVVNLPAGELPEWARPGMAAQAEVLLPGGEEAELAIPVASVVQDELTKIFFRRHPRNPDKVIRVEADLGVSDGRWVVVQSGVMEGDEVVLNGVYELKLSGSDSVPTGGHFHADGTWHAGNN